MRKIESFFPRNVSEWRRLASGLISLSKCSHVYFAAGEYFAKSEDKRNDFYCFIFSFQ